MTDTGQYHCYSEKRNIARKAGNDHSSTNQDQAPPHNQTVADLVGEIPEERGGQPHKTSQGDETPHRDDIYPHPGCNDRQEWIVELHRRID